MTGTAAAGMAAAGVDERFAASRALFETTLGFLDGAQAAGLEHAELETHLQEAGRELFRQLMQDHLELRAQREQRLPEVTDAGQVARGAIEAGHTRALTTVFGEVTVTRLAYRRRRHANLYPADAALNLPVEKHSHGLRQLAALEAARGSFDDTAEAIERATGVRLGKRQAEALAGRAAADVDDFYAQRRPQPGAGREVLVLSADGKGIVMRPEALRPATAKAAASATTKLSTRLSKGEKRNRKRLAEVGAVYDADPVVRTPADILARGEDPDPDPAGPGPGRGEQVVDRQRHPRRRHRGRPPLRRSRPPRPHPRAYLDRAGRRQQPPDRPDPGRSHPARDRGDHPVRLHPRPGVPVCATRRSAVSPAQRGEIGGNISGSDGLPGSER